MKIKQHSISVSYDEENAPRLLLWSAIQLKTASKPVTDWREGVMLAELLIEWAEKANAAGVAANQLGIMSRACLVQVDDKLHVMLNPYLEKVSGKQQVNEGCLSFPEITVRTERPAQVRVTYQTPDLSEWRQFVLTGVEAASVCHELEHLDGRTMLSAAGIGRLGAAQIAKKIKWAVREHTRKQAEAAVEKQVCVVWPDVDVPVG